jgi:predicted RNA-binding protein with EMAP domain
MLVALLEDSLDWHVRMLQNADDHKSYLEKLTDAKIRLKNEIEAIRAELSRLRA